MPKRLEDLSPEERADFDRSMAEAADRFESGEFGGPEPEFKPISDLPPARRPA